MNDIRELIEMTENTANGIIPYIPLLMEIYGEDTELTENGVYSKEYKNNAAVYNIYNREDPNDSFIIPAYENGAAYIDAAADENYTESIDNSYYQNSEYNIYNSTHSSVLQTYDYINGDTVQNIPNILNNISNTRILDNISSSNIFEYPNITSSSLNDSMTAVNSCMEHIYNSSESIENNSIHSLEGSMPISLNKSEVGGDTVYNSMSFNPYAKERDYSYIRNSADNRKTNNYNSDININMGGITQNITEGSCQDVMDALVESLMRGLSSKGAGVYQQ